MFFASCIANEIFIINRCNLAKDTNFFKHQKIKDKDIDDEIKSIDEMNESEGSN